MPHDARPANRDSSPAAFGIDLGTTTCSLARLVDDERVECYPIEGDSPVMPTALFLGPEIAAGDDALRLGQKDPERLVEAFKREMGEPHFNRKLRDHWVPPEVLSGFMLDAIRRRAQRGLGPIRDAVVTVPAYFDERRRRATLDAGKLAGLNVTDLVNEPVAAALAELWHNGLLAGEEPVRMKTLVYDLGGGTFDVSVLEIDGPAVTTMSAEGDIRLGGRDFDELLVDFIAERFAETHGADPRCDYEVVQRLWVMARRAKHELTELPATTVDCGFAGIRMSVEITRADFEYLIAPYLERTLLTANDSLQQAGVEWGDLDQVLLVGGSSRIPAVAAKIRQETGREPTLANDPDLVVAQGAALFAAMPTSDRLKPLKLVNVNAHSLGIAGFDQTTKEPVNRIMIPRNSRLPASKQQRFVTIKDDQKTIQVKVVEGENRDPSFCTRVGTCVVSLGPGLPARTEVTVTMQLGSNGTLSVACKVPATRHSAQAEIRRDGLMDLETLPVWRERLLKGNAGAREETPDLPRVEAIDAPDSQGLDRLDLEQVVKRIDFLCQSLAEGCESAGIPAPAVAAHGRYVAARREFLTIRYVLEQVRAELAVASSALDHTKLRTAAATVRTALKDAEQLLLYTRIAFGAECAQHPGVPPECESMVAELRGLRLQTTGLLASPNRATAR